MSEEETLKEFRISVAKEMKLVREIISMERNMGQTSSSEEKQMIASHLSSLKASLKRTTEDVSSIIEDMNLVQPLSPKIKEQVIKMETMKDIPKGEILDDEAKKEKLFFDEKKKKHSSVDVMISDLERRTLKRLKQREIVKKQVFEKKPSSYVATANRFFGEYANSFSKKNFFMTLKRDLIRAHLEFTLSSYISLMMFSVFLVFIAALVLLILLLSLKIGLSWPIIGTATGSIFSRFIQLFWIVIVAPMLALVIFYAYPSLEKKYIENKIDQELPFATIHMSAIAGSLVEPSKMFNIIISTGDYPFLEKELIKLINEVNIYGYDLVTALKNIGFNNPSKKLAELLNGIAITINSGGSLQDFFDKRAQSLLFDYRIEREKYTKTAETFMDIYISLVIAAPMILMLLLIMMRVSGLGISLSTSMLTLVMVLGVVMINIIFLTFLQLKQPTG